jgi:hypothetical protein
MANTEMHRVVLTMSVTHRVSFSFVSTWGLRTGLFVIRICQNVFG